jgi:hypothetical protein
MERLGGRLDGHVTKANGVRLVDDDGAAKIREAIGQTTVKPTTKAVQINQTAGRLEGIERSIMALVESHRQAIETHGKEVAALREPMVRLLEENRRLSAQVEMLVEENRINRLALAPSSDQARQVKAWSPEPRPDPAAGLPWWRVAWLSIIAPEQLRRWDS